MKKPVAKGKKLAVLPIKVVSVSTTGLIKDDSEKPLDRGEIISAGDDVLEYYKIGDIVVYNEYAGKNLELDGIKYLLLNLDELYCSIEDVE